MNLLNKILFYKDDYTIYVQLFIKFSCVTNYAKLVISSVVATSNVTVRDRVTLFFFLGFFNRFNVALRIVASKQP